MRPSLVYSAPLLSIALLSACGSNKEDSQVTETRMEDIDSLEGTISDDMINTDESTDQAPLEAPPAGEGGPNAVVGKGKAPDEEAAPEMENKAAVK